MESMKTGWDEVGSRWPLADIQSLLSRWREREGLPVVPKSRLIRTHNETGMRTSMGLVPSNIIFPKWWIDAMRAKGFSITLEPVSSDGDAGRSGALSVVEDADISPAGGGRESGSTGGTVAPEGAE